MPDPRWRFAISVEKKRQHFVPQHYLRNFRIPGTEQVQVARIEPYLFIGPAAIRKQCQEDYFYGKDGVLEDLLGESEKEIAPVLVRVVAKQDFDQEELSALRLLAIQLHARTRKSAEIAKIFPRYMAREVITNAIERGELPPPLGGVYTEDMMDFGGVPGMLLSQLIIPGYFETATLDCKLLRTPTGKAFLTSDHPVVLLNEFCAHVEPARSFVGFSRSGFQLLLPLSSRLCLFLYDLTVYKVGARRHRIVEVECGDVEIVNALQVQSAESCLYFDASLAERDVEHLVRRYSSLRTPIRDALRTTPLMGQEGELLHLRTQAPRLPRQWSFCQRRRHTKHAPGDRRDPSWSEMIRRLMNDIHENPGGGDVFRRIERILDAPGEITGDGPSPGAS